MIRRAIARFSFVAWLMTFVMIHVVDTPIAFAAPTLRAETDTPKVGVGDVFTISVNVRDEPVRDSDLNASPGFDVIGTSQRSEFVLGGQGAEQKRMFLWTLRARKLGTFSLAPVFRIGGVTVISAAVRIDVTADPPRQQQQRGSRNPDPFGINPFAPFFEDPLEPRREDRETVFLPDAFSLPAPRGATVFLHALVDKKNVVVGEQVTHAIYIYERHNVHGEVAFNDIHEPAFSDFYRRHLLDRKSSAKYLGEANVGGEPYAVKLILKSALFPLRAGKLSIGAMRLAVTGRPTWTRESEVFSIDVTEPPMAGRPPGYLGDVGRFRMKTTVNPREVEAGGSIAVTVEIEGSGNVPAKLNPPETADVHWLEPQINETVSTGDDSVTGKRTFTYIVRLKKPGKQSLGTLTLPFYDPQTKGYQTLRSELGDVRVTGTAPIEVQRDDRAMMLDALPAPRMTASPLEPKTFLTDSRAFFAFALVPPFGLLLGQRSLRGVRALRDRLQSRRASPEKVLAEREKALKTHKGDAKERMALAYALLEHGYRMHTGRSLRGSSASTLSDDPDLATWVQDYEAERYAPEGPSEKTAEDIAARALAMTNAWRKT